MRHNSIFAGIALEEEALAAAALPEVQPADFPQLTSTDELPSIVTVEAGIDTADNELDKTIGIQAAFEEFREILGRAFVAEGLSDTSADILAQSTIYLNRQLGIKTRPVTALESYQKATSEKAHALIALESIKDTAVRIWKAIVAAMKKLTQWVKDLWVKIFNLNDKTQKDAEELQKNMKKWAEEKAARKEASEPYKAPATFNDPELYRHLVISDEVPSNIYGAAKIFNGVVKETLDYDIGFPVEQILNLLSKIEHRQPWKPEEFRTDFNKLHGMRSVPSNSFWLHRPHHTLPEDMQYLAGPQTFGNKSLMMVLPKAGLTGEKAIDAVAEMLIMVNGGFLFDPKSPPMRTLSIEECHEMLELITDTTKLIGAWRARAEAGEDAFEKKVYASVDKIQSICNETPYAELAKELGYPAGVTHLTSLLHSAGRYGNGPASLFARVSAESNQYLLQYVNKCFHLHAGRNGGHADKAAA